MQPVSSPRQTRDHGGNLDAAVARYGGAPEDWLDLSTGINPVPYPISSISKEDWMRLPDIQAQEQLLDAVRRFWSVPSQAALLAAPGASALIARIPDLLPAHTVQISTPTYNEHAAAFSRAGWQVVEKGPATARVVVHPNNPDGRLFSADHVSGQLVIVDESFCDICPDRSLMEHSVHPGVIILKSFGKFWGLAGLRLGFAIGDPALIHALSDMLGPWPVSGPALRLGTAALSDDPWAMETRRRLAEDRIWLDHLMQGAKATVAGGTDLFGLYEVENAADLQDRLARSHVWTRIFPYSRTLIRLGMPAPDRRQQLEDAL